MVHADANTFASVAPPWLCEVLAAPPLSYADPLPIQQVVLPQVCAALASGIHMDVCLSAPTGAGKTLCYLLPIVRHVAVLKQQCGDMQLRAVVLVPTPALGAQVVTIARALATPKRLQVGLACGDDRDTPSLLRATELSDGRAHVYAAADIVVATPQMLSKLLLLSGSALPGAVVNRPWKAVRPESVSAPPHLEAQSIDDGEEAEEQSAARLLAHVELLVIDEADEVLCGAFTNLCCRISDALEHQAAAAGHERPVHKMLCSATLTSRITNISELRLRNTKVYALDSAGTQDEEAASGGQASGGGRVRATLALPNGLREHLVIVRKEEQRHAVLLRVLRHAMGPVRALEEGYIEPTPKKKDNEDTVESTPAPTTKEDDNDDDGGDDGTPQDDLTGADEEKQAATKDVSEPTTTTVTSVPTYRTVLVFVASNDQARVLSHFLASAGMRALEFTAAATEVERRQAALDAYRGSDCVIVATDALMRGIDLPGVSSVVMYDAPRTLQQYVHRIGRTARAGRRGHSFILTSKEQVSGADSEATTFASFAPFLKRLEPVAKDVHLRQVDDLIEEANNHLRAARTQLLSGWASAEARRRHVSKGGPLATTTAATTSADEDREGDAVKATRPRGGGRGGRPSGGGQGSRGGRGAGGRGRGGDGGERNNSTTGRGRGRGRGGTQRGGRGADRRPGGVNSSSN